MKNIICFMILCLSLCLLGCAEGKTQEDGQSIINQRGITKGKKNGYQTKTNMPRSGQASAQSLP